MDKPKSESSKAPDRADLVRDSYKSKTAPQSWRTRAGERVTDDRNTHTLKFNGWFKTEDFDSKTPMKGTLGHMTVKWGRGNDALYTDYRGGADQKAPVRLEPPIVDKRDPQKVIAEAFPKDLQALTHTPSGHAKSLVGRTNDSNDKFRHNARFAMRVKVTPDELERLQTELSSMERQGNYGLFKEMDTEQKRMVRCMTPIEALAKIKNPEFKFSEHAIHPHQYMEEFAKAFPESTSKAHFRAYSGASVGELNPPGERMRVDPSSQKRVPRRPVVKF